MSPTVDMRQVLDHALELRRLEEDLQQNDVAKARERAGNEVDRVLRQAGGVPMVAAAEFLGLSTPSVRKLRDAGVLERYRSAGPKLSLSSVLDVYWRLDALRSDGQRRGLVEALAQEAADRSLVRDPSLAAGLAAMRRGEYVVVED
ncbi:hypothetical protein [Miltoncostaea oceani]|uniref:hypothetical protein n=1 Tax=Miltoncostaea oceani TaxID=2843216 RepID=UPI001C3C3843|nr:hypothetical protein [Miltoncostaea oceani]